MSSLTEQLRGTTWKLESYQSEDKNGNILYPLGEDALGFINVTPDNRLSVHIMAKDRNAKIDKEFNTEAEREMAELGYHAYTGPFTLDEKNKTLTTNVELSLLPSYVGSEQTRSVRLEGNTLYLSNVKHPERKLVWKKV